MKMNLTCAIEILKLHKHTTDKFKHSVGDQYVSDAIDTVISELEKPTYTAEETQDFAEWCALMEWIYDPTDKVWFQKYSTETKTTAQLRKLWEQEMDVNTSEPPNSKQQCPTYGSDSLITLSDITYCMDDCCDGVKGHN